MKIIVVSTLLAISFVAGLNNSANASDRRGIGIYLIGAKKAPDATGKKDKQKPGVISRYSGPGDSNMYQSKTKKKGTGTIRLETVGSPLKRN